LKEGSKFLSKPFPVMSSVSISESKGNIVRWALRVRVRVGVRVRVNVRVRVKVK
jgi:hypothetical protein